MSFTLGGKTSSELGLVLLSRGTVIPGGPATRDRILTLPGRAGALDFGAELQPREFVLHCAVTSQTREELVARLRELVAHLCGPDGRPRTLQLVVEPETDSYYQVRYTGSLPVERWATWGQVSLPLTAYDPFAYAVSPEVVVIMASPHAHTQWGTAPGEPLLRLQGVLSGGGQQLSITIGTQTVTYRGALATGDWLEIDCRDMTAVRVVGVTRTRVLGSLERPIFPQLPSGASTITVTPTGGATWSRLEMHCRNRWL